MTAARAFKKYWVRYTDMGAAFDISKALRP